MLRLNGSLFLDDVKNPHDLFPRKPFLLGDDPPTQDRENGHRSQYDPSLSFEQEKKTGEIRASTGESAVLGDTHEIERSSSYGEEER